MGNGDAMAGGGPDDRFDGLPEVRSVVIDRDALVRVRGTLDSSVANTAVIVAVAEVVDAGATDVVLDLADVDFAGVDLVSALAACSGDSDAFNIMVLRAPKTMLLAVDALRMRGRLDLRDEPTR